VELREQRTRPNEATGSGGRVALRVDADGEDADAGALGAELVEHRIEARRDQRADVRAVRVEERHEDELAPERGEADEPAILVAEREVRRRGDAQLGAVEPRERPGRDGLLRTAAAAGEPGGDEREDGKSAHAVERTGRIAA